MNIGGLRSKQLLAAVVFVAATIALVAQVITPSPVMVSVGENSTDVTRVGQYFTYSDVGVIAIAACLLGSAGTYLLSSDRAPSSASAKHSQRQLHSERSRSVHANEKKGAKDGDSGPVEGRYEAWENAAERLRNNEAVVYTVVLEADGKLAQRRIVEKTELSKATVSRTLDTLESKGLVERKRRGMGNVVTLQ